MRSFKPSLALFLMLGSASPAPGQDPAAPNAALLNPLAAIDPAKLEGFLGRPLFSPLRRPPPAAPSDPPAETPVGAKGAFPPVRLVGIVRTPKENIAQLVAEDGGERFSVRAGDFLGDWSVTVIDASTVTLTLGEQETRLEIFRAGVTDERADGGAERSPSQATRSRKRAWSRDEINGFFGSQQ